jgi:hypothetical protein
MEKDFSTGFRRCSNKISPSPAPHPQHFIVLSVIQNYRKRGGSVKRPCERTWRDILGWAWNNRIQEFTHQDLLQRGVVSYRGNERAKIRSASSSLYRMWQAGLLTRLAAGKGRRASLYTAISREEYKRTLERLVLG